ncbi:MAG: Asp-tRNA(Asn)/Glu-tRNA(Gln) amidotransferase subunit GatA [Candidatus Woesebacteria bacterium]|nr:Asp-tRNA(Asn)/Glu-tRNA(Gln) amidotransferase subunit GatA [Candidatus Woesebacteria bacterium]
MIDLPLTIKETQEGLINKKFSAVELVDSYLARINKYNKELNVFLTVTEDIAYKKAKEVDDLLSQNNSKIFSDYQLLGVTVAHKDLFLTKGIRTTAGSNVLKDYVPTYSATVVDRLEKAGTITLGKVNCDAWAHGSSGENSDFGRTLNPWNKDYVSGGSSSGSAAALSANMSLVSTGTDTCGSIRLPANFNYLVSLKPTYGVVSRYGVVAMASSLDSVGPIGHSVDDVRKLFDVTCGEDGFDSTVKNINWQKEVKPKLKIGIAKEFFGEGLDVEVKENINKALKVFERLGIEIKKVEMPSTKYAISVYYIVQPAEVSSNLARYDGIRYGENRSTFGDEAKRRIMLGSYVLSSGYYDAYYLKAMKVRTKIRAEVDNVFNQVDILIAPVSPTPPFKIGEKAGDPLKMYLTDVYAATANLSGIPALSIPFTFSKKDLPLGFQLMGPRISEYTLFALGEYFEKETVYKTKFTNI